VDVSKMGNRFVVFKFRTKSHTSVRSCRSNYKHHVSSSLLKHPPLYPNFSSFGTAISAQIYLKA